MTRDKEYITKYLEDNYCVVANFDFEYVSKKNNSYFNLQEKPLKNELLLIFGNFIGLGKIFDEWSEYHKNILTKGLFDYFNSLDLSLGSKYLTDEIIKEKKFDGKYNVSFIDREFEKYYMSRRYDDLILNSMAKLDSSSKEYHTSSNLVSLIVNAAVKETNSITDKIELKVNEWYYDNVFKQKLDDFFSKCWLSLGETNWVVKHPLYGTFDEKSLITIFNGETTYQKSILRKRFDQWYEENIYEASEMAVKNLYL